MAEAQPQSDAQPVPLLGNRPFDGSRVPQKRNPHVEAAFERMLTACAENLRHVAVHPARYALEDIKTERLGAVLDNAEGLFLAAVFYAPEWDARLLFLVDRAFVFTMAELLFGGDGGEPAYRERRPFTEIETHLGRSAMIAAADCLQGALASLAPVGLRFERLETRMEFAAIAERTSPATLARIRLSALGRSGELQVVIPQSALALAAPIQAETQLRKAVIADPGWSDQLQVELGRAEVRMRAVLEERRIPLAEIAALRIGQVLQLEAGMDSRVRLECDGRAFFYCAIGQAGGSYTLKVEDIADRRPQP